MSGTATTQLNVRMPRAVRDKGDKALEARGYSPTGFIRKLWERVALQESSLDAVIQAVESEPQNNLADAAHAPKDPAACRAEELWSDLMHNVHLSADEVDSSYDSPDYAQMLDAARAEQFGLLP